MIPEAVARKALERLAELLSERGVIGEVALLRGAAMMLAFQARTATKDVDAIFSPVDEIKSAARQVAAEMQLQDDWLNDAANEAEIGLTLHS